MGWLLDALGVDFEAGFTAIARFLVVLVATMAFVGLAMVLIAAGVISLLGVRPGDVVNLTPPGRAGAVAQVVAGGR